MSSNTVNVYISIVLVPEIFDGAVEYQTEIIGAYDTELLAIIKTLKYMHDKKYIRLPVSIIRQIAFGDIKLSQKLMTEFIDDYTAKDGVICKIDYSAIQLPPQLQSDDNIMELYKNDQQPSVNKITYVFIGVLLVSCILYRYFEINHKFFNTIHM